MTPKALIIGADGNRVPNLVRSLQALGCDCQFVNSFEDACQLIAKQDLDLVFSPVRQQPGTISSLIGMLAGSQASLFCSYAVKDGCWWLPVMRRGESCLGSPAFQPGEFADVLVKMLREIGGRGTPQREQRIAKPSVG